MTVCQQYKLAQCVAVSGVSRDTEDEVFRPGTQGKC